MDSYNLAEAKANLSALVGRAEAGEEIEIKRRGRPVARIVPIGAPRKPLDLQALHDLRARMPYQEEGAGEFIRRLRDGDRY